MSHQSPDFCWCHGVDEKEQQSEVRIRRKVYINTMHLNALPLINCCLKQYNVMNLHFAFWFSKKLTVFQCADHNCPSSNHCRLCVCGHVWEGETGGRLLDRDLQHLPLQRRSIRLHQEIVSLHLQTRLELETKVSIVSYSCPSLMIIALASQFHVYLPWGQRPFSIVS